MLSKIEVKFASYLLTHFPEDMPRFLPLVSRLMAQITSISVANKWQEEVENIIPGMVNKFIQMLNSLVQNKKEQAERVSTY